MHVKPLFIDIETYCSRDLRSCGVYAYADPTNTSDFEITLIGLAIDNEPVKVYDFQRGLILTYSGSDEPKITEFTGVGTERNYIKALLSNRAYLKVAHNAQFEMACLESFFKADIYPEQWCDTMALARMAGLPASLAALSKVLELGEMGKQETGKKLIQEFSRPAERYGKTGYTGENDLKNWEQFCVYNRYDVEAERLIYRKLSGFIKPTDFERSVACLDHTINRRGIEIDQELVKSAIAVTDTIQAALTQELEKLTGLDNPNSNAEFKKWLKSRGINTASMTKDCAPELLKSTDNPTIRRAIELKFGIAKASVKKYKAIRAARCWDNRIRGMFQYYGAARSGRWSGRLVQLQNLKRNSLEYLDKTRSDFTEIDEEDLKAFAKDRKTLKGIAAQDIPEILGQLIRTAFIPSEGNKFIIADFSAIEARVIAWLARETWRQEVFAHDGDIYKSSYSQAFGVPIENITKDMRQKGKIMELALGYGGSVGALKAFGADKLGLDDDELKGLVDKWRKASPRIVKLWRNAEDCARLAIAEGKILKINICQNAALRFSREVFMGNPVLMIQLPSGRFLCYQDAKIEDSEGKSQITYMDCGDKRAFSYSRVKTHGGKLVENITQAVARDCLAEAMLRLESEGFEIVAHVHDEVIIDAPLDASTEKVEKIMGEASDMHPGLHLSAHSYEGSYYFKD